MKIKEADVPKTRRTIATITNSRMEVGDDHHGFYV